MDQRSTHLDLQGKRVTVMGLGTFGGGVGSVQFLAARGAIVTITDLRSEEELAGSLADLDDIAGLRLQFGKHVDDDFTNADLIVVNPAVPRDNGFLQIAQDAGIPLTSEMNLFWQSNRGRVIGVTGSNGKSTTTALIHSILKAAGKRCWLGGNIGRSLLPVVDRIEQDDWVVLELSSFQLDDLNRIQASPDVAIVTNFSPNHIDWHGTLDAYRIAKQTILRWQRPDQIAVLNSDDAEVSHWTTLGMRHDFSLVERETAIPLSKCLKLPGQHNVQNALAAINATSAIGIDVDAIRRGIESYEPLPHRLQFIAEVADRRFYNDSLATTPESAIAALDAFIQPVVLLAGGYDKQVDLCHFATAIAEKAKAVALMGQTAEKLARSITSNNDSRSTPSHVCRTFPEAFRWAVDQSAPGDVVLLSPGCASYDWFRNFADRGEQFVTLVTEYSKTLATCQ